MVASITPAYADSSALETGNTNQVFMVQVTSPATLPEGFQFEASFEENIFTVVVPAGGVTQGQTMIVPYSSSSGFAAPLVNHSSGETESFFATAEIPIIGRWRDGLCDCLRFGPFHPTFLCGCCFPQLLNAQIMTRLKLDWLGDSECTEEARKKTFRNVVILVLAYFALSNIFSIPIPTAEMNDETGQMVVTSPPPSPMLVAINNVINISFTAYTIIAMMRTRYKLRMKYRIPEARCHGCEDFCCVFWCGCCSVGQMARHTADYSRQKAAWCTADGLQQPDFNSYNAVVIV